MEIGIDASSWGNLSMPMEEKDTSGGHGASAADKQDTRILLIPQFAAICKHTTEADQATGKPADTTSKENLARLLAHGKAGGVVSIEMAREMQVALFARAACDKARAFLGFDLDFPSKQQRDVKGAHFKKIKAAVGLVRGYCRADFESRWRHLQYAAVKKGKQN